jgi:hypothetical protein
MKSKTAAIAVLAAALTASTQPGRQATKPNSPPRLEFSRMLVHWRQYTDPGYLAFVDEVQPEVVQAGPYGVDFWAFGNVPKAVKGPNVQTLPVDGDLKANGQFLENLNKELHKRGIKVIGHFDVEYHVTGLIDGPQGPREGFFKFYNELWDEKELGPKPVKDPLELLQRNADGSPLFVKQPYGYSPWPLYHGCLNNPYWRAVLKAFVKRGIERGVDGFIANYFYTNGCMCKYCVQGFKDYLRQRYSPAELRMQFGIDDLDKHKFTEIPGGYEPNQMTPLRLEGLRFADLSRKQAFDEIFIQYGRSLKPDLIVAQWLHSYQPMPSFDERFTLPAEIWGKGEDYLWYSVGKAEPTLQLRYMRGAGGGRPFTACHYEMVKIRAAMAELAANGGAPMTRFANFNDPESRRELVRYFRFMKQHDDVYHANTMAGECVLLHPRSQLHLGRFTDALSAFEAVGKRLLDDHIIFDVLPDDIATPDQLARYKRVFTISSMPEMQAETYDDLSRFEAPTTVRVSASHPEKGSTWDIHFVNYNRKKYPGEQDTGYAFDDTREKTHFIADEKPIPVSGIKADLVSPAGFSISKIEWMTPESPESQELRIEKAGNRVRFTAPEFLVYAVARVYLASGETTAHNGAVLPTPSTAATSQPAQHAASRTHGSAGHTSSGAECCDPTVCAHPFDTTETKRAASTTDNYIEDIRAARQSAPNAP